MLSEVFPLYSKPTSCSQSGSSPHFSYFRNLAKKKKKSIRRIKPVLTIFCHTETFPQTRHKFPVSLLLKPFKLKLHGLWENEGCNRSACAAISYLVGPTIHCFILLSVSVYAVFIQCSTPKDQRLEQIGRDL